MRALFLALALIACSPDAQTKPQPPQPQQSAEANLAAMPTWEEARAQGVDFRAVGQEPGWMLDIHQQGRIVALLDYGEARLEFPLTQPSAPQEGVTRYDTQANGRVLSVSIRRFPCEDAMSGAPYPARVELNIDGRVLTGCGKSV